MYRRLFASVGICLVLGLTACGGAGDSGDEGTEPAQTSTAEAADTASPTQASEQTPEATATSGSAGGDNAAVPEPPEGPWTGGQAEVRVVGSVPRAIAGPLLPDSETEAGTTGLIYADGLNTINFSISTVYQPFAVWLYQDDGFDIRNDSDQPCEVTYVVVEDNRLEGTFRCEHTSIPSERFQSEGPAALEGSFTATR